MSIDMENAQYIGTASELKIPCSDGKFYHRWDWPLRGGVQCCSDCDLAIKVSYEIKQIVTPAGSKKYHYERQEEQEWDFDFYDVNDDDASEPLKENMKQ